MDVFYPQEQAADSVEKWNIRLNRLDSPLRTFGLTVPAACIKSSNMSAMKTKDGRGAKAIFIKNRKEAVLTMVGALYARSLPPVKKSDVYERRIPFANQHATIVGFNTPTFNEGVNNLRKVAYELHRVYEEGEMQHWSPGEQSPDLGVLLSSNCRYFTVGHDIPKDERTTFNRLSDPEGFLSDCISPTVAHCFDNDVAYLALVNNEYVEHNPTGFRTGDIVEMGFAIVAWPFPSRMDGPRAGPQVSTRLILRTLTFLEGTFTKKRHLAHAMFEKRSRMTSVPNASRFNQIVKRKRPDDSESDDVREVRTKMQRLVAVD
ncbi:hypothetical protein B0H12DRAFT_1246510 [Mycena haematopus]|nr:hypothetical protein B0H12DRAFT_1246510 [Mycena haematopus]